MLDFLPIDGISPEWLKEIYNKYVFRSKATGKDGITQAQFRRVLDAEIELICARIATQNYKFTRFKEVLLSRGATRCPRQISVPTIRDRLAIRAALEHLKHAFPEALSPPPHRYIKAIKTFLNLQHEECYFLRMDIRDFYPSIRHDYLISQLEKRGLDPRYVALIVEALSTPTGDVAESPEKGVPQGLAISNILASIYMQEFDTIATSEVFYKRYVDDILVIASVEEVLDVHKALEAGLSSLSLASHTMGTSGKTEILKASEGVQYLGYELASGRTSIRRQSLAKMFSNLAKVLTSLRKTRNAERDLFRLNLKVTGCIINNARRGWLMFFSQTEDVAQLSFLDRWLSDQLKSIKVAEGFEPKKFRQSYYEIRFNLADTDYVPNFDQYDLAAKTDVVRILSNRSAEQVDAMDVELIEAEFSRLIGREISELERDIMQAFS